jgi:hypothetical protein
LTFLLLGFRVVIQEHMEGRMESSEAIKKALKEMVLPELSQIHEEYREIKTILELTNRRLDDVNIHLADQSRRIDETNQKIDAIHMDLIHRIDEVVFSIGRLHNVVIRREEHEDLKEKVKKISQHVGL